MVSFKQVALFSLLTIFAQVYIVVRQEMEAQQQHREDPSTIKGKFMVGYQGWFNCPGDGEPIHPNHHGWIHWMNQPLSQGGRVTFDMWPDVSELDEDELYTIPEYTLPPKPGTTELRPAKVFSSRHPKTVRRHFRWMREHAIAGVFMQRFLSDIWSEDVRKVKDEVMDRVRDSAEAEGRVWSVMYDISGAKGDLFEMAIMQDWTRLVQEKRVLDSPMYLHENGHPVIAIWGFGMNGQNHDVVAAVRLVQWLKANTPSGAYIFLGTPTFWRETKNDCEANPALQELFLSGDCVSPWMVGRYSDNASADAFRNLVHEDMAYLEEKAPLHGKTDYSVVVFPGFSWTNLNQGAVINQIPRRGGEFLWRQLYNARKEGASMIYGAMFDEYDEGTNLMPGEPLHVNTPQENPFLSMDADGQVLPGDWYLRICGLAAMALRSNQELSEEFPRRQLEEYWNPPPPLPPRYDPTPSQCAPSEAPVAFPPPPVLPPRPQAQTVCAVAPGVMPPPENEWARKLPPNPYHRPASNLPPPRRPGSAAGAEEGSSAAQSNSALDNARQEVEGFYDRVMTDHRKQEARNIADQTGKLATGLAKYGVKALQGLTSKK